MAPTLAQWILHHADDGLLSWQDQQRAARRYEETVAHVERVALQNTILPRRYARQRELLTCAEQLALLDSYILIVGCGGLGGHIVEGVARLGIGTIHVVDFDRFDETNLNRQTFATLGDLGRLKVAVARERVETINPAISMITSPQYFDAQFDLQNIGAADVVIDALGHGETCLRLAQACRELNKPLIHGAFADWSGQVATVMPGEKLVDKIYAGEKLPLRSPNTLSFIPACVAALQVAETVKLLLGKGQTVATALCCLDLLDTECVVVAVE